MEIKEVHLDFQICQFYILSIVSFLVKPDLTIKIAPLFHNPSLYKKFFISVTISFLIIYLIYGNIFIIFFTKNKGLESKMQNIIFGTYFYFFNYSQSIGMIFTINSINFYRLSFRNNYTFWVIIIFIIFMLSFIFCIGEYSFHPLVFNNITFEYSPKNVDTFDDKNKFSSFLIYFGNITSYYLCTFILLIIFNKMAKNELEKKRK